MHHDVAHDWFAAHRRAGWATCPLTEGGFIRTAVALSRGREPLGASDVADRLRTFTASGFHEFWKDEISVLDDDSFDMTAVFGHQQITDIYLLGLAVRNRGALATFDRRIPLAAVKGATTRHIAILSAVD